MFDVLTYEKGASVLRMLEQYLGAEPFRDGIRVYLQRHQYANAETTDLWDALEESTKQPVRALMDSWIFQPGFPLISVAKESKTLVLSQQIFRYIQDGTDQARRWHVPIFLRVGTKSGVATQTLLLTDKEQRISFADDIEWAVVNAGTHGFYRVRYSAELAGSLKRGRREILTAVERFSLINDAWATTLAGLGSLTDYLDLIELLRDEDDVNVWTTVIGSCHHLLRILDDGQCTALQMRLRALFAPVVERFGWSVRAGESELTSQLRGDLIGALGTVADDKPTQERARELFAACEKNPDVVDRNLLPALVSIVAHTGGGADYEKFSRKFKNAQTPQEETRYLFALGNFREPQLIERTLALTISGDVRTQNSPYLMRGMLMNRRGRERAWPFMKNNWQEMLRQYPDNSIPRMCEGIIGLVSAELEADVTQFFSDHPVKQGSKRMAQHLERLRIAVACQQRWESFS
jgi:puromycin-sensitive aminopeptidase